MAVTIKDVAKLAGVSTKTVSRTLNNESYVQKVTHDKVMAAVTALDYQPSFAARHLAGSRSYSIAFIYDNPNAHYVTSMQEGILASCKKHGYELIIQPCKADDENLLKEIATMVKRSSIAGLILTPPFSESADFIKAMYELGVKIVGIKSGGLPDEPSCPGITINDRQAAFNLTQHLVSLGHKQIGFITGGYEHKSTSERLLGYLQALHKHCHVTTLIFDGEYSFDSGVKGAKHLLSKNSGVTAIVACNDEIAAGAVYSAKLMGINVPEDLSVAGFENSPFSRQTYPALTSADQPNSQISKNAADLLVSLLQKKRDNHITTRYTPQLILRESTASIPPLRAQA
jgi:LacI family transcriptional regulator